MCLIKRNNIKSSNLYRFALVMGAVVAILSCRSTPVEKHRLVGTENDVDRLIRYKHNDLAGTMRLKTATYWAQCKNQNAGVKYGYISDIVNTGEFSLGLFFRLKSQQGAFYVDKVQSSKGKIYPLKIHYPEEKLGMNTVEYLSVKITDQQLHSLSKKPVHITLLGKNANCSMTIAQPVSAAFQKRFAEIFHINH